MKTIGKALDYFGNNWLKIMVFTALAVIAIFGTIPHANACEQRTNLQTGQTVLFGANCTMVGVSPPMILGSNGYYPQGSQQYQQQQPQFATTQNGQQVGIPPGVSPGQSFTTNIGGVQHRCSWADKGLTAIQDGAIGNGVAYIANRITKKDTIDRTAATVAGALYGAFVNCDPDMVNDDRPQQVAAYQQQNTVQQNQPAPSSRGSEHVCGRDHRTYNCHDKVPVFHDGDIQCLSLQQAQESGDERCTGIQ